MRVTVNDFILTVIAEGLSNYVRENSENSNIKSEIIECGTVISLNARVKSEKESLINCRVGCAQISLPLCSDSERMSFGAKLAQIKREMDAIKRRQYSLFSCALLVFTGALPACVVRFLISLQNASVIVSNICGPRSDSLFLKGRPMLCASGVVQNSPGIALSFCVTGYNGHLSVSLLADQLINGPKTAEQIMFCVEQVLRRKNCLN